MDIPSIDSVAPIATTATFDVEIAALRAINPVVTNWKPHIKGHCHAASHRQ